MGEYRVREGHYLKYNVRMCYGCNTIQPREKGPASKQWRCKKCRAAHENVQVKP